MPRAAFAGDGAGPAASGAVCDMLASPLAHGLFERGIVSTTLFPAEHRCGFWASIEPQT